MKTLLGTRQWLLYYLIGGLTTGLIIGTHIGTLGAVAIGFFASIICSIVAGYFKRHADD